MATITDYTQLAGIFKSVWGNTVLDPFKYMTPIVSDLPLETPGSDAGGEYKQAVLLAYENGITHAAPQTTPGVGGVPYIGPNAGATPAAAIQGAQYYARTLVAYETMMRSLQSINGNEEDLKKAVKSATKVVMMSAGRQLAKRVEVHAIHGGSPTGLGVIESISAVASTGAQSMGQINGTNGEFIDVSIAAGEWSEGIWAMQIGATYDCYTLPAAGSDTSGTKQNSATNTALGNSQTGLVLVAINPAVLLTGGSLNAVATGRVLRFFHTTAGATGAAALAIGRALFYESSGPWVSASNIISIGKEMAGLDLLANIGQTVCFTGFGNYGASVYGLNSLTYDMWGGNRVQSAGNMRIGGLMEYLAPIVNFGVMGQKVRAVVPTKLFQSFATDESSLRRYNGEQKKAKNGFSYLEYNAAGGNTLEVIGHAFQKDGKCHAYPVEELHRIGPQDISFLKRGNGEFVMESSTAAASEMRAVGQFNMYADSNKHLISINGITY